MEFHFKVMDKGTKFFKEAYLELQYEFKRREVNESFFRVTNDADIEDEKE